MTERPPIAMFVYNRPDHALRALESLQRANGFDDHRLTIFSDGPTPESRKDVERTREVCRAFARSAGATVVERAANVGVFANIQQGMTDLLAAHSSAIAVEDDLVVGEQFLDFVGGALDRYADCEHIMQVSGHSFIQRRGADPYDNYLARIATTWGWGTWARAWSRCDWGAGPTARRELAHDRGLRRAFDLDSSYPYSELLKAHVGGEANSWGIVWWWHVFRHGGLVAYPNVSLVSNGGEDGSGVHTKRRRAGDAIGRLPNDHPLRFAPPEHVDASAQLAVQRAIAGRAMRARRPRHLVRSAQAIGGAVLHRNRGAS